MDKRIEKVREDIRRTEAKRRELDEYLKTLQMKERQLCDEEIIRTMRSMAGKGDVLEVFNRLRNESEKENNETGKQAVDYVKSAAFSITESEDNDED